jgi:hypothetical protein
MLLPDEPTLRSELNRVQDALDTLCPGTVVHLYEQGAESAFIRSVTIPLRNGAHFSVRRADVQKGGWEAAAVDRNGVETPTEHKSRVFIEVLRDAVALALMTRGAW